MSAQRLATIPGTCTEIRVQLEQVGGTHLEGVTYKTIWNSLVTHRGQEHAEEVIQDVYKMQITREKH